MSKPYIPIREDNTLRPYQQEAKKKIYCAWSEVDDVMFQMPTGTGKTRLFTSIISDINQESIERKESVKILIIAHRTELIDQIDKSLNHYRVAHNIYGGPKKNRVITMPVVVSSIQTLTHKNNSVVAERLKYKVKFIIIDEAHHSMAESYRRLWDMFPYAKKLGVTATPWRMSHSGFRSLYQILIQSWPVKKFIHEKWLSPYTYYSLKSDSEVQRTIDDIDEFDTWGDYKEEALERKMDVGRIRAQLLNSYKQLAWGKHGIIYSINKAHSKHICAEYKAAGLSVVDIDDSTPAEERRQVVEDFKEGKIDIIVNVNIFSEGFDCPAIEFIQLARPTRSLSMYIQQVGRGLRIMEGKPRCLILDNVGMYSRFGLPDASRHWQASFNGLCEDEGPKSMACGMGHSQYHEPDTSEGTEDMVLIQSIENEDDQQAPQISEFKETAQEELREYKIRGTLLNGDQPNEVYDLWYEKGLEPHVQKLERHNGKYYIRCVLTNEEKEDVSEIEVPVCNELLNRYIKLFRSLHTAVINGKKTPHKALLLLATMDMVEKGMLKVPRFNLSRELVLQFMTESDRYHITKNETYPITAMPYYHMRNEPFWTLHPNENCKTPFSAVHCNQLNLNAHFSYAEIDKELFLLMQTSSAREKLRKVLEEEYNLTDLPAQS